MPDERIDAPIRNRPVRRFVRGLTRLAVIVGAGWLLYQAETLWPGWRSTLAEAVTHLMDHPQPVKIAEPEPVTPPAPVALPETVVAIPAPVAPPDAVAVDNPSAADPAKAEASNQAADEATLAEPPARENPKVIVKDPLSDPLQKRAATVGLSPDLSRVLLTRLTEADFRNASMAIEKAFAEPVKGEPTPWPRKAKAGEATFRVHFVQGAARNCRRYVVTIDKNGWTTTAPAMQKCGADPAKTAGR